MVALVVFPKTVKRFANYFHIRSGSSVETNHPIFSPGRGAESATVFCPHLCGFTDEGPE
jgi:hypothetical protein